MYYLIIVDNFVLRFKLAQHDRQTRQREVNEFVQHISFH